MLGWAMLVKDEHVLIVFRELFDEEASVTAETRSGEGDWWLTLG